MAQKAPPTREALFGRAIDSIRLQADPFAKTMREMMVKLGHTWRNERTPPVENVISAEVITLTGYLVKAYKEDSTRMYYSASTGGILVEIIFWPKSSPESRLQYIAHKQLTTFDTYS